MALSNDTKVSLDNYKSLLDIANAFGAILDDPKSFLKIIKDANTLSEAEEAKIQTARDYIADYSNKVADLKRKELDNDEFKNELEQNNESLKAFKADLDRRENDLNKRDSVILQKERDLASLESALDDKSKKLQIAQDQLDKENIELNRREESLDIRDESLKAKEDKLRGVLNG